MGRGRKLLALGGAGTLLALVLLAFVAHRGMNSTSRLDPSLDRAALRALEERLIEGIPDAARRARVRERQAAARSLSLEEKARHFMGRVEREERLRPRWLVPIRYRSDRPVRVGEIETTSHLLAALALEHRATGSPVAAARAGEVLDGIVEMDRANGLDGYLPKEVELDRASLRVRDDETHANVYAQLHFAHVLAFRSIADPGFRRRLREHQARVSAHLLDGGMKVRDAAGVVQPHGDLSPKRLRFERSRALGGLLAVEAGLLVLDGTPEHAALVERLREQRRALLEDYGYDSQIQVLTFRLERFHWPTTSSSWLNFQKLHALLEANPRPPYRAALRRLWEAVREHANPLFSVFALAGLPDIPPGERARIEGLVEYYLETFPLESSDREVTRAETSAARLRVPSRYVKARRQVEAEPPLPIFMRPMSGHEWKRLQGRVAGNRGGEGLVRAPGTDYLLAYWLYRAYRGAAG